jgi:MFS family permease
VLQQITNARRAVLGIFLVNGLILGSWIPHIPLVQEKLNIGEGLLGLALLSMAAGAVIFMPISGVWITRLGSRKITTLTAFAYCFALPLPIIAPSFITLLLALFFFGACTGAMDIAMNAQAVAIEKRFTKPIMSSFHGFFSVGGLLGSGIGGLILAFEINPLLHALLISGLMFTITALVYKHFLPKSVDTTVKKTKFVLPRGPVLALGILAFMVLLAEGAIADWSSVYITKVLQTGPGIAALGYASFSLMMAIGRLSGDRFVANMGAVKIARLTSLIAAIGLGATLLIEHPIAAIIGFGCVGLGLSNLIPIIFSAAGRVSNMAASTSIAAVATAGYFGFLAGPPIIGFIAEFTGLPMALGLVVLAISSIAVCASIVRK